MQKTASSVAATSTASNSSSPARLALISSTAALLLLALLHGLSPELDPSWHMVSEYAVGRYGGILAVMFLAWAGSCAALFFALRPQVHTRGGRTGLGLLLVSAAGMALAAVFDFRHSLHGLATLLGIPTFPAAAVLISLSLSQNPAWSPLRGSLLGLAHLAWISLVVMFALLFIGLANSGGQFGPGVLIGWPNRLFVVAGCGWLALAALRLIRLGRE